MKKFSLYSESLETEIVFKYGSNGILIGFEFQDTKEVTQEQLITFVNNLPWNMERLKLYCDRKKIKLTEVQQDLSFDNFWNRYDYKESNKKKSRDTWERMSDTEKAKALAHIPVYNRFLTGKTIGRKYANTYLNQQPWNN